MLGKHIHGCSTECSDTPAKNMDYQEHSAFQIRTAFWENLNTISPMQLIINEYSNYAHLGFFYKCNACLLLV